MRRVAPHVFAVEDVEHPQLLDRGLAEAAEGLTLHGPLTVLWRSALPRRLPISGELSNELPNLVDGVSRGQISELFVDGP